MISMTTTAGSATLLATNNHGDLLEASEFELHDVRQKFPGLTGETELQDRPGGRDLVIEVTLFAADTATMNASIQTNNAQLNQLTGTLVMSGPLSGSWANVTFKGFSKTPPGIRRDAAGNRVFCEGLFRFRQHIQD